MAPHSYLPAVRGTYAVYSEDIDRFDGEEGWIMQDSFGEFHVTDHPKDAKTFDTAAEARAFIDYNGGKHLKSTVHQLDIRISRPLKAPQS